MNEHAIGALRSEALRVIADDLGLEGDDARSDAARRLESVLGAGDPAPAPAAPEIVDEEPTADPVPPVARGAEAHHAETGRRRIGAALLLVALLVGTALFAIVLSGGSDDPDESREVARDAGAAQPSRDPAPAPARDGRGGGGDSVELASLTGTPGKVSVRRTGNRGSGRLAIELEGLPGAGRLYRVWLYNSVIGSIPLGPPVGANETVKAAIPRGASAYEFLDVSLQAPGDRGHSGQSVFRAPVERALPRAD